MAAAAPAAEAGPGRMDTCMALLRGSLQSGDAAAGRAAQAVLGYAAERAGMAQRMMLSTS